MRAFDCTSCHLMLFSLSLALWLLINDAFLFLSKSKIVWILPSFIKIISRVTVPSLHSQPNKEGTSDFLWSESVGMKILFLNRMTDTYPYKIGSWRSLYCRRGQPFIVMTIQKSFCQNQGFLLYFMFNSLDFIRTKKGTFERWVTQEL